MIRVQRKYKVLKHRTTKEMAEDVNRLIQHEYKDKEGFLFHSSGRWQCLGGVVYCEKEAMWVQSMVFIQEEDAWKTSTYYYEIIGLLTLVLLN